MAGDWIKMRSNLDTDPRVFQIAAELKLPTLHVVGLLWKCWSWADQHSVDASHVCVTAVTLDCIVSVDGFADALRNVGWLEGRDNALSFPRFAEHNSQTAKQRCDGQKRTAKYRRQQKTQTTSDVTASRHGGDNKASPEKRRGEKSSGKKTSSSKAFVPPTVAEVAEYCHERGNTIDPRQFVDHYAANGWMRGKNKIKDWRACVRTWERNVRNDDRRTPGSHAETRREQANASVFNRIRAAAAAQRSDGGEQPVAHIGTTVFDETASHADGTSD